MGIKDVFDRIKGKSGDKDERAPTDDAPSRRQTNEETIQVNVSAPAVAPSGESQERATVVARPAAQPLPQAPPASPSASDEQLDATAVAGSSRPPALKNAGPAPRAPIAPSPGVRPSVTPVAPSSDRVAVPQSLAAAPKAPQARAATATPAAPISSADDTVYQKPAEDNALDFAAVLVGIYGEAKHEVFRLPCGGCKVGRADGCEIQLLDAKVSREHASVRCVDEGIEITALNDRNPVFVNDEAITGPRVVADGDKIQFGNAGASILRLRTVPGL